MCHFCEVKDQTPSLTWIFSLVNVYQVIQAVTFLFPNVGGHQQPLKGSRWRSPTTFEGVTYFHHPKKVTNSQNCQAYHNLGTLHHLPSPPGRSKLLGHPAVGEFLGILTLVMVEIGFQLGCLKKTALTNRKRREPNKQYIYISYMLEVYRSKTNIPKGLSCFWDRPRNPNHKFKHKAILKYLADHKNI